MKRTLSLALLALLAPCLGFGALLGDPAELPLIAYFGSGGVSYSPGAPGIFFVESAPVAVLTDDALPPFSFDFGQPRSLTIEASVDASGALVAGPNSFLLSGTVDLGGLGIFSGSLLEGDVVAFGFANGSLTDLYDFRVVLTGGDLAGLYGGVGATLVIQTSSEGSNFDGSFTDEFGGDAKGNIGGGPDEQLECAIEIDKTCCIPPTTVGSSVCEGKVTRMLLEFTGGDCTATTNPQSGKATCSGVASAPADVVIGGDYIAVPSTGLEIGDVFEILPAPGETKFNADTSFSIGGQELNIHTSCSKTLSAGDTFGAVRVLEFESEKGGLATLPAPPDPNQTACIAPNSPEGLQCTGKLVEVVFEYTGKACAMPLENPQSGKAQCFGDPGMAGPVQIKYIGKDADEISVSPDMMSVNVGDQVRVTATGRDSLHADTMLEIADGSFLQALSIHTSCSKPLALGDEFGGLKVVGFSDKNGVVSVLGDPLDGPDFQTQCELPTVPGLVEYQYNVTNPSADALFITVIDDKLGTIVENHLLPGGGTTETFFVSATLDQTTENTATVAAAFDDLGVQQCAADVSNNVLVTLPPPPPFVCKKPITELTMVWDGDVPVDIKAYPGPVGSGMPFMVNGIQPGDTITVPVPPGAPNDVFWEIFDAGMMSKIGESKFHISCSDPDMNGPEDCGKNEGDGKSGGKSMKGKSKKSGKSMKSMKGKSKKSKAKSTKWKSGKSKSKKAKSSKSYKRSSKSHKSYRSRTSMKLSFTHDTTSSTFVNDWLLAGMVGANSKLVCEP